MDDQSDRHILSRRSLLLAGAGTLGALALDPPAILARRSSSTDPATVVGPAVQAFMQATGTPGVGVGLHFQGQDHFYNFGQGSPGHPVNQNTVFEIGSVTKSFTATLLAYQVVAGQKRLTDPVTKYLPSAVQGNQGLQQVTLQDLATHTAGMPDQAGGKAPGNALFAGQPPGPPLLHWWESFTPQHPPGTYWLYSDIGFVTLGFSLIGANGGPTYSQLLQRDIAGPLGLRNTTPRYTTGPNVAQGTIGGWPSPTKPVLTHASDLKSTPQDMLTWLKAQLGIFPAGTPPHLRRAIALTHQIRFRSSQIPFNMGLAWQFFNKQAGQSSVVYKDGAVPEGGSSCVLLWAPQQKIAMAFLTNKFAQKGSLKGVPMAIVRQLIAAT
jgi:CubicO group peptidase (beta-lactamase class C family)